MLPILPILALIVQYYCVMSATVDIVIMSAQSCLQLLWNKKYLAVSDMEFSASTGALLWEESCKIFWVFSTKIVALFPQIGSVNITFFEYFGLWKNYTEDRCVIWKTLDTEHPAPYKTSPSFIVKENLDIILFQTC